MSRNNDVFNVLVTKDDAALIAADNSVSDLAVGQIGVFDYDTNLSIDHTTVSRNFYLAVGLDLDGDTVLDDISKSAGTHIQGKNVAVYNKRDYIAGTAMEVVLKDYTAECETEYGVKLELRNQEIYRTQGFNQFTKTYSIKTACCDGCEQTCPSGDANEITKLLKLNINNDPTDLVTAIAIARHTLTKATIDAVTTGVFSGNIAIGAEVSDADLLVLMEYNSLIADVADSLYTDLEITTVTQGIKNFCDVNLQYFYPRQTVAILSKIHGFECTGEVEVTQEVVYEEGAGYDVKQLEYEAIGWTDSPYRLSSLNGVANPVNYNTDATANYDMVVISYEQFSTGGFQEFLHPETTIVAVPTADTTTMAALILVLNAQLTQFTALT